MKQYLRPEKSKFNKYSIGGHFVNFFNKIELYFLIILCVMFIFMSRVEHPFTKSISSVILNISMPIIDVFSYPFKTTYSLILDFQELANAKEQNIQLKQEKQELEKALVGAYYIKKENEELKEVLKFAAQNSSNYMTSKIIGRTYNLFSHNFIVKHLKDSLIKNGSVTVYKKSVIGRVVKRLDDDKSLVLLLTDAKSRIPVICANSRNRGILAGNNSAVMEIKYLSKDHGISEGELVFTSGNQEQIPSGILAGIVTKVKSGRVFVKMAENINDINQVTILQF